MTHDAGLRIDWVAVSAVATGLLAIVTAAFVLIAFLQRGDMKAAATASLRAAEAAEASVVLQHETAGERSRLATYPALGCEYSFDSDAAYMRLFNASSVPAFDIDVVALAILDSEHIDPAEYFGLYRTADPSPKYEDVGTSDGFFAVYDHLVYDDVLPRRVVTCELAFVEPPEMIQVLLQFRDLLGRNYMRLYWAYQGSDTRRYTSTIITDAEAALRETRRIPFDPRTTPDSAPEEVRREFAPLYEHSIPSRALNRPDLDTEDRGDWTALE